MEQVAALGGLYSPFENIIEFVVGQNALLGPAWSLARTWRAISRGVSLAWMQYNCEVETVGPNKGRD